MMKKIILAGCIFLLTVFSALAQPTLVGYETVDITCNGGNDGSITISVTGGLPPYRYTLIGDGNIDSGPVLDTFYTFTNLTARSYGFLVVDALGNGFSDLNSVTLSEPGPITIQSVTPEPVSCNGFGDGQIDLVVTGESGNYQYQILPGGSTTTSSPITGLDPGTYTIRVTDLNGCSSFDESDPVEITEPDPISVSSPVTADASCFGSNDGTLTVSASGGNAPYNYTLNPGGNSNSTGSFTGLGPNTYSVDVTDANACPTVTSSSETISEPAEIVIFSEVAEPVSCNGDTDGKITVVAGGGTPPYTYTLSPGNIQNTLGEFDNLSPGTYTVSVTDANLCGPLTTGQLTVDEPLPLTINIDATQDVSCNGAGDGQIQVSGSGGTAPLEFILTPGNIISTTGTFNNLSGGIYTVTITDAEGCTGPSINDININDPDPIGITLVSKQDISCNGLTDGEIVVSSTGGTGEISFTITPGGTTNTSGIFSNLGPGNYSIEANDENACPPAIINNIDIIEPLGITFTTESSTDITCAGDNDGIVSVEATGGTPPFNYVLNETGENNSTGDFGNLGPGTYTVTVTDASSCPGVTSAELQVEEPQPITIDNLVSSDISCNGAGDGQIQVTASGGTEPLSYTLDPGSIMQANGDFNGLNGGVYSVTVNDANGCPAAVASDIQITDPDPILIIDTEITNISCNGESDGEILVSAQGGTGQLRYTLNESGDNNTTGVFAGLGPGTYSVTVSDENGCPTATASDLVIDEPGEISVIIAGSSVLTLSCAGDSNGAIDVTISGGSAPYNTQWTGPNDFDSDQQNITDLSAGTYILNISDANGCNLQTPLSVEITQPEPLTMNLEKTDIICNGDNNGTITVNASGGTAAYEYSRNGITYQPSNVFTGLSENTYTIYTRDANGCLISESIFVDEPEALTVASEIRFDNNLCYGDTLGEIRILEVNGGVEPYLYSINDGTDYSTEPIFQNLPAGTYPTRVQDANGCEAVGSNNVINEPPRLRFKNYISSPVTGCFGNDNGQIFIEAEGGTTPRQFSLDSGPLTTSGSFSNVTGGEHIITLIDDNECQLDTIVEIDQPDEIVFDNIAITDVPDCAGDETGSVSISAIGGTGSLSYSFDNSPFTSVTDYSDLAAGTYDISVQDENECTVDSFATVNEPDSIRIQSVSQVNISCPGNNDGRIEIIAEGGTPGYTYTIVPGGAFNSDGIFTGLSADTYTLEVTDAAGCGPVLSSEIIISEPIPIVLDSVSSQEIFCYGDDDAEIHIYVSGGTEPYEYSIDNGSSFGPSGDFVGLSPGNYVTRVQDANGCSIETGTFNFTEPAELNIITETATDITGCAGDANGSIVFEVDGGTGTIEYSIDDGDNWQTGTDFNGLNAGSYMIMARDDNNCNINSSILTLNEPQAISAEIITTPDIDEDNKGSITINNPAGGTGELSFSINGTDGPFTAETVYNGLDAGSYDIVITDQNDCSYEETVIVSEIIPLDVTVTITNSTCFGSDDGSIRLTANNATGQPEYSIDDSATWSNNGTFEFLEPGEYFVFARDEEDRYFQDTITVDEPIALSVFRNVTPASCSKFSNDGAIDVTVNGAIGNVSYQWATGETSEDLSGIPSGDYIITATDENMCSVTDTIEVSAITTVIADAGRDTAVCYGDELQLNGSGGTVFAWSPAEGLSDTTIANPVVNTSENGTYVLRVEGMNNCYDIDSVDVTVYPRLGLSAGNDTSVVESQEVIINTTGGPYINYNWEPSAGVSDTSSASPAISITQTTTYIVSGETENGCIDKDTITISLVERLEIYNAFSPNGDGINDYWDIEFADLYPDILVEVFNRWGEKLYSTVGYSDDKRWDGKFNGTDVPVGTYYYVIVPYSGATAITGTITVVR